MSEETNTLYDELYHLCDTVIHIEEVNLEDEYRKELFKVSMSHLHAFFKQFDARLSECSTEDDLIFVKESTLNFIIFSLKKLISDYECPDENIEFMADHLRDQILQIKRKT